MAGWAMTLLLLDLERTALSSRHLRAKSGRVEAAK